MTFTKLFSSITESTIWMEPDHVRLTWITMLAMADRQGRVYASVPGLAHRARVDLEQAEDALDRFRKPDPHSRSPEHEGRRIEDIDGGWRLLNHAKYRTLRDEEAHRESKRLYAAKRRAAEKQEEAPPKIELELTAEKQEAKEIRWRVEECWKLFLAQHDKFFLEENGKAPPHPKLTPEIVKAIKEAIYAHDREWLLPDQREEWVEKSWARAAGAGLFLSDWHTANKDSNRYEEGGTRYLEAWRPWKRQRGKPDPVEQFARLYFEIRDQR